MATFVVGGHTRNIGKTSLTAAIIGAFPERAWVAMKITQYGHGICSINGRQCGCAVEEHSFSIQEERAPGKADSARFLAAGARRSFWVRTKQGQLHRAMPELLPLIRSEPYVIIESNSILRHIRPDLYVVVLNPGNADFKASAREFLPLADAAVVVAPSAGRPQWERISQDVLDGLKIFPATPPEYLSPALKDFIATRLETLQ